MVLLGIIISILIFSIVIIIHELGHYGFSRLFKVHVEEFGLGIPPRAKSLWKNKKGTLFSLNWIPLGGFVKIAGESKIGKNFYDRSKKQLSISQVRKKLEKNHVMYDEHGNKISDQERIYLKNVIERYKDGENFFEKSIIAKTLILAGGVIMNFLLAIVLLSLLFFIGTKPVGINSVIPVDTGSKLLPNFEQAMHDGLIVKETGIMLYPVEGSIAKFSGIQDGDKLLRINRNSFSSIQEVQAFIAGSPTTSLTFYLERKSACRDIGTTKESCDAVEYLSLGIIPNTEGKIGSYLGENLKINNDFSYKYNLVGAIKAGSEETLAQTRLTLAGLKMLGGKIFIPKEKGERKEALEQVSGPIGIVSVISSATAGGIGVLIFIAALISINLGIFNLLPIPALDGGRLFLLWIREGINNLCKKEVFTEKTEHTIHMVFFLLLIILSVLIAYKDIFYLIK